MRRRPSAATTTSLAVAVLAVLAYVPALRSSPGRMPADTKVYLYLDPARLISDAPWTFDGRQFAGWVPHQVIAYLWPQGPWYWLGETVGLPDWLAHRLWIGTLFLAAGTGVLWLGRRLGLGIGAALAAALVYQCSPYLLPYVSRTSAMLLPWAGLGWIVGLTILAATRSRWRYAALTALVIVTVGSINATALMMIAPAPVLWLLGAAWQRQIAWRRAMSTALRIGGLSLAVSVWWIVMLVIQGRHGADVLAYSESLESVSLTSTSPEVWRNLGYWLTYVRDAYAATTTAARDYMVSGRLIATGFVVVLVGLAGLVVTRWQHRAFAVCLVVVGVVLGVGVHPIDDPSPVMDALVGDGTSGAALALRSSTRAVPMVVLGLALGAAALADALGDWRPAGHWRPIAVALIGVLAVANLPSLTSNRLVDPALERDEDPPAAWQEATAALDAGDTGARVLQLPGQEFGAFRWGYTVDAPLPGMTDKPLVTRDLLPLGSAAAMDLLYALDDRVQSGTLEPDSLAPLARLLGADRLWLTNDAAFDRFRTARPEIVRDAVLGAAGVGPPQSYGEPVSNVPDISMIDEQSISDPLVGEPLPTVDVVPVDDVVPVVRAKDEVVLVAGSGDGVVDAAAAGLLDGTELIRYTGSLADDDVPEASQLIVTDSNRDRAHHWRSSQDVVGFTEDDDPSPDLLREDPADERLPVFGDDTAAPTIAVQVGPVRARATAYGEPFAYRPENRPFMAVDGDASTAWVVADRADPVGEMIRLDIDEPIDHLTLQQPEGSAAVRHVGRVSVGVDDRPPFAVDLGAQSFEPGGQRVDIEPTTGESAVTITVDSVLVPDLTLGPALAAVGFAEIGTGLQPTVEVVRTPADAVDAVAAAGDTPVSFVLSRLRARPSDRWRADPEPAMVREIELPDTRSFVPSITVRLDQRATDAALAELLGIDGPVATSRLTGVASAAGWNVADGDTATSWITPFSQVVGSTLAFRAEQAFESFELVQPTGDHSSITGVRVAGVDAVVPPPDSEGRSAVTLSAAVPAGDVTLEITSIEPRSTLDRRYAEPVVLPAAIAELSVAARATVAAATGTGCRDDLVTIDGVALPIAIRATVAELLAGDPVDAALCGTGAIDLGSGTHMLTTTTGSGLHVDRIVLADSGEQSSSTGTDSPPTATVTDSGRLTRDVTVDGCRQGCWLVLGEGFHDAWSASADGRDLGPPQLVDGGFNGWWIDPTTTPVDVSIEWTAQTPLTIAFALTAIAVLACIALSVLDRRRELASIGPPARLAVGERPAPMRTRWIAAAAWVVSAVLFVGPGWGLVAAVAAAVLVVLLGRPRLAGIVTMAIVGLTGAVMVRVVQDERPWPDAGWPGRFEWLHGLGMFAAVSLLVTLAVSRSCDGRSTTAAG